MSHNNLGVLLKGLGQGAAAEEQYRKALAIQEKLAADFPAVPDYRQDLALSHNNLGDLLAGLGQRAAAEEQYRKGLAIREKLAADFPAVPAYRQDLARSHNNLGLLLAGLGQGAAAAEQFRKALAIREKLAADFPAVPAYRQDLAGSHNNLGNLLADLGQRAAAAEQCRQALAIFEKLAADFPAVPEYRQEPGREPQQPGGPARRSRPACGGGGAVPPGPGDPGETGRRLPRRARVSSRSRWQLRQLRQLDPRWRRSGRESAMVRPGHRLFATRSREGAARRHRQAILAEQPRGPCPGSRPVTEVRRGGEGLGPGDRAQPARPATADSRAPGHVAAASWDGDRSGGRGRRVDEVVELERRPVVRLRLRVRRGQRQDRRQEGRIRRPGDGASAAGGEGGVEGRRPPEDGHRPRPAARTGPTS